MGNIVEIDSVSQSFKSGFWLKDVEILHDVSLNIPEKSVFGFLGANGAGKTTLIHLIAGFRKPKNGSIRIAGFEASSLQAKTRVGYLPERPYFYEHLTGESLLEYFGVLSGMRRDQVKSRIPQVLSTVGLREAQKIELGRYSKGMLQRIGIAQAILHNPELLVLDEPMSGLDPLGRKEMRELIVQLSKEGHTVFFSSHVIPDVEAICDQVAIIQKGKMMGCGPIGSFLSTGPLQTEIGFQSNSMKKDYSRWSEFESLREMPNGFRGIVSRQENVTQVIRKLIQEESQILWVTPIRPSLEDLFTRGK